MGTIQEYTREPSLSGAAALSNSVPVGTAMYAVDGMGGTLVACEADGGVAVGLPRLTAARLAVQTLIGTGVLQMKNHMHPGIIKDQVCSPGGSTIQGVRVLEEDGFRGAVMDAVIAAYEKTLELGK